MLFRRLFLLLMLILLGSFLVLAGCTVGSPEDRVRTELITVVFVVTATPDPNATPNVIIITATTDRTQVNLPENLVPQGTNNGSSSALNITPLPLDLTQSSSSNEVEGCLTHTVEEGDTMFGIAEIYGVNPFVMLEVNGMTEETAFLNIGDALIVPIEGCPIEQLILNQPENNVEVEGELTEEVTAEVTESANTTPTVTPTITLAPTADDEETDIEIVGIVRAGDVTAEGVRIRNNGRVVNITGWVLSDADGNSYTFVTDQMIFSNAEITVYTRTGQDVPVSRFWGLETAVWQVGDVVTLRDADENVQASYRVPESP